MTHDLDRRLKRREFLARGVRVGGGLVLTGAAADLLVACGSAQPATISDSDLLNSGNSIAMDTLKSKAKAEGNLLNATGIPPEWADYQDILTGMQTNFGVTVDYKAQAEYSSAQEIQAIKSTISGNGFVPDIGDVGPAFGVTAIQEGLVSRYKNAHWNDIPDLMKEASGLYAGEYYGVQAFVVNKKVVNNIPQDWSDLMKPEYKNKVGIDGDPRQATDALMAVWSASLANGGSVDDVGPGIDFFAKLKKAGNYTPARSDQAHMQTGEVGIGIFWDYLGLGFRDTFKGNPDLAVVIPPSGSLAGYYVAILNKHAKHPFTARLWNEYIFSDEGQLFYLKGYAHPARYQALVSANKIPADLSAKLPSSDQYKNVKFVTPDQQKAASAKVTANWT
ncbi:MAG TPA: extracellular solute-binding protein [Candidatus Limnocylindrales bacterium]|nr:extracellular solute-binding protein [Candidatus Limnocylindrales bacterium]